MKKALGLLMAVLFVLGTGAAVRADESAAAGGTTSNAAPAPKAKKAKKAKAVKKKAKDAYVCPMCHTKSDKPGKCPDCGMDMVKESSLKSKAAGEKMYACNKCGLEANKPGECPHHCGGTMVEKK